jgi:hypothetical protein
MKVAMIGATGSCGRQVAARLFLCAKSSLSRRLSLTLRPGAVESTRTPPGEAPNWPTFFVLLIVFAVSLVTKRSRTDQAN